MLKNLGDKFFNGKVTKSLLVLESIFVLALALYMIGLGFTHDKEWGPYLGVLFFALIGSASLFALARGIEGGKRWATSPAIFANLIAIGVASYQIEAGLYFLAVPIIVVATVIIIGSVKIIRESSLKEI
jgi:hypothetical protein